MSAAEFQRRIADLTFSAQEHLKALRQEQNDSEENHSSWEDTEPGEGHEDHDAWSDEEPDVIDHSIKIAHIETAIGHLEAAVDELDGAIDE